MRAAKQRLLPIEVPWQISPSASFLKLLAYESPSDGPTQVSFVAHFGLFEHHRANTGTLGAESLVKAASPHESSELEHWDDTAAYQLVRISFERGLWIRMLPGFSDGEVLDPAAFDFSALPFQDLNSQNLQERHRAFWRQWIESKACPDPRMYEVERSAWLEELHLIAKGCRHFVVCGHDAFIEVIAKSWKWKSDGALHERGSQQEAGP